MVLSKLLGKDLSQKKTFYVEQQLQTPTLLKNDLQLKFEGQKWKKMEKKQKRFDETLFLHLKQTKTT